MAGLLERIEKSSLDRRRFVQLAATAGVVASLGLTGCDNKVVSTGSTSGAEAPKQADLEGGEWKTFNCTQGSCAMRCVNQAYVVDGIILRQRTDAFTEDTLDNPQSRSCLKGRSYKKYITGADRLKYPMKRKNWQPGGGTNINGQLRGIDEWERISWDDGIKYVADELTRIRDTYGNRAFLALGQNNAGGMVGSPICNLLGGCLTTFGQQSQGGSPVVSNFMRGTWSNGMADAQDRIAIRHTKLIVMFGYNPAWNAGGGNMIHFLYAKQQSGAKVILIDPFFNPTAQTIADQWIPVRPGTDGALLEAIAYELIQNDWIDHDFLDRCTVGFDSDHMPSDAKTNENFKDYILGVYDDQPKTPEWASTICGASSDMIRDLAQQMGTVKPMTLKTSCGVARSYYGNRYTQLFYTVGWMTGSVGVLGAETVSGVFQFGSPGGVGYVSLGGTGYKNPKNPICTETRGNGELTGGKYDATHEYGIAYSEMFKAVVTGEYTLPGPDKGKKRECDIKCIVRETQNCPTNQEMGANWMKEAYRKVEFVFVQEIFLSFDARYADIVLPAQSTLEKDFSANGAGVCPADFLLASNKVIEPYFECKDDLEIFYLLCDQMGFGEDVAPRATTRQLSFNALLGATVAKSNNEDREPLLTVTEEDLRFYNVEGTPQEGRVPIQEFMKTGVYHFQRSDNDAFMNVFAKAFRDDPEANPIKTPSGKYEIYCQTLKDYYDNAMLHDIDALPKYKPAIDGYEQARAEPTYPFQLITQHQARQIHSMQYNVKALNEVFPNDFLISEYDAEKLGLKKGDWIVASCAEGGKVARRINVVPYLMPGVVLLGEGNWQIKDQSTGIDIGANVNTISRTSLTGDGYQAYNTILLKIEKYSGPEIELDYKRPQFVPIAKEEE
jgi:anaerobic dimethyl sulfoxide reductase subunit A